MNINLNVTGTTSEQLGGLKLSEVEQQKIDVELMARLFRYNALVENESERKNASVVTAKERHEMISNVRTCYDWVPTKEHSQNFFITFFTNFVTEVKRLMVGEHTLRYWRSIPGYKSVLLLHYVQEGLNYLRHYMKHDVHALGNTILTGTEKLITMENNGFKNWLGSTFTILVNPRFVSLLMDMFFGDTNGYDLDQVFFTLDLMDGWFNQLRTFRLRSQQRHVIQLALHRRSCIHESTSLYPIDILMGILPNNFNTTKFERAIEMLVNTDHFQIVTRTLIFIYNVLDMYTGCERLKFTYELLLKNRFYELFLHWNYDVRACFYRILTYKINRISILDLEEVEHQVTLEIENKVKDLKLTANPIAISPSSHLMTGSPSKSDFARTDGIKYNKQTTYSKSVQQDDILPVLRGISLPRRSLDSARPTLHQTDSMGGHDDEEDDEEDDGVEHIARRRSLDGELHTHHETNNTSYNGTFSETAIERLRMEKGVDLILDNKIQVYIKNLKYIAQHGKELEDIVEFESTTAFYNNNSLEAQHKNAPCPKHLYKFVGQAIHQYAAIKQESDKWRSSVLNHLINKKKQLMNSDTITVIPVLYPNLVFPKFTFKQADLIEETL
jgi:hypothetical protein